MATFLFDKIIFGPVKSRRLGNSLGINLLPVSKKLCNFDCVYCECGWSHLHDIETGDIPSAAEVITELRKVLFEMKAKGEKPDVITYAGNGEPTMHPQFPEISKALHQVRNEIFPGCRISLLSNSALLNKKSIMESLAYIDQNIMKLDTAIPETFQLINKASEAIDIERIINNLASIKGEITIQTLFLKGTGLMSGIDNTTDHEIDALLDAYGRIKPVSVMVYSFFRDTPSPDLLPVDKNTLEIIASRIEKAGFKTELTV